MHGPRPTFITAPQPLPHSSSQSKSSSFSYHSRQMPGTWRLFVAAVILGVSCCVSDATSSSPGSTLRLRGGSDGPQFTAEQIKRLPWYLILENSPLKLGDGPYGLPYVNGRVNPKNTLWESNPKLAMSKTLWNLAEDNAGVEQAEKLLKIGADPNFADPNTKATPLHLAAMHGNTKLAVMLVESGGDIKKRASKSGTALEIAQTNNHPETVTAMLDAAARKN